jgi:hypothetical protein
MGRVALFLAALFGLPMTTISSRPIAGSPTAARTFEHVAADPRIDIEIVSARLAGLGERSNQDARAPLGRMHIRAGHVADADQLMAIAHPGPLPGMTVVDRLTTG